MCLAEEQVGYLFEAATVLTGLLPVADQLLYHKAEKLESL